MFAGYAPQSVVFCYNSSSGLRHYLYYHLINISWSWPSFFFFFSSTPWRKVHMPSTGCCVESTQHRSPQSQVPLLSLNFQELSHFWGSRQLNPCFYPMPHPGRCMPHEPCGTSRQELSPRAWLECTGRFNHLSGKSKANSRVVAAGLASSEKLAIQM